MSESYEKRLEVYSYNLEAAEKGRKLLAGARNKLFIVGLSLFAVYATNALPTEIPALGVDLSTLEARPILPLWSLVCLYFLVLFLLTAQRQAGLTNRLNVAADRLNKEFRAAVAEPLASKNLLSPQQRGVLAHRGITVMQFVVPALVGIAGSLVGFFPDQFEWLRNLLTGWGGAGGGR